MTFGTGGEPTAYERSLDLRNAVVRTTFQQNGITFEREVFASRADEVLVVRLTAGTVGALSFEMPFTEDVIPGEASASGDTIHLQGNAFEKLHSNGKVGSALDVRAQVLLDDGTVVAEGNHLVARDATAATILVAVGSDWLGDDPAERPARLLEQASSVSYEALKQAHIEDYAPH